MKAKLCVLVPILFIAFLAIDQAPAQTTKPTVSRTAKSRSKKAETRNPTGPNKTTFPPTPAFQAPPPTVEITGISPLYVLIWLLVYFSPTIVALIKKIKNPVYGTGLVFYVALINTFFGWFCLGWGVAWIMVFTNLFGKFSPRPESFSFGSETGTGYPLSSGTDFSKPFPEPQKCLTCNGSGQKICPSCFGRGSWFESPTTENGGAQLVRCNYCCGSGKVQCTH
jgi:hypothetical protein